MISTAMNPLTMQELEAYSTSDLKQMRTFLLVTAVRLGKVLKARVMARIQAMV